VKGMDLNKLMQQATQMQEQVLKAQQEAAKQVVEGSAGGVVTVKATGAGKITEVKIDRSAIDPDDPEMLEDLVLAAVNSALEAAEGLMQSKLGGMLPDELGGLLPGF
jgi:DNA-binding YbaB/EbfC family protein